MDQGTGAAIGGILLFIVLALTIGVVIGAIILRAAAKWGAGLDVPFGSACVTVLLCWLANIPVNLAAGFLVGAAAMDPGSAIGFQLAMLVVGFLINSGIVAWRLELSFGRAALVVLLQLVIVLCIGIVLGLVVFAIASAVGG